MAWIENGTLLTVLLRQAVDSQCINDVLVYLIAKNLSMIGAEALYIVALTPGTAERGLLWFQDNAQQIAASAKKGDVFWAQNTEFVFTGKSAGLSQFLRRLDEMGYKKEVSVRAPGDLSTRGGIVDIFPINAENALRVEFVGNTVKSIHILKDIDNRQPNVPIKKIAAFRDHDRNAEILYPGMLVVHIDHGIGKLQEIAKRNFSGEIQEYFVVAYAGGDTLYVPKNLTNKIGPYIGFGTPSIHRLGGNLWEKIKRKAKEDLVQTAKELARLYAERELSLRAPYQQNGEVLSTLAETFPYEETRDQTRALEDVLSDMDKETPMDRLICGDVGFGKTEVAVRALGRAVLSSRQVAFLAPTTVLAWQHFENLKKRLARLPIKIAMLSRVTTREEIKDALAGLETGTVDAVIGTHRILSKDVVFKNLGLLIIDEEQKFGVKQKEKLRSFGAHLDVLSLSATPIPRTLSFSLTGVKDISVINTPPLGRLPIKTIVAPYQEEIVREAIRQELARGGQVYVLHNRIDTIERAREKIARMFPATSVVSAHAELPEHQLISIISEFLQGKINILVATTIIENGLDVRNVNTLIVDDATRLGLSQAHQIRGRIGRSDIQAYAYLLHPPTPTPEALGRLAALKTLQYLGAGYQIALKDLEMRGAGNFLGRDQSGTVNRIGFNLYCQMLQEAIEEIKINGLKN